MRLSRLVISAFLFLFLLPFFPPFFFSGVHSDASMIVEVGEWLWWQAGQVEGLLYNRCHEVERPGECGCAYYHLRENGKGKGDSAAGLVSRPVCRLGCPGMSGLREGMYTANAARSGLRLREMGEG